MLCHASNSTKWSPLSCNKNQLVAPLLVCTRERGFLKGYSEGSSVFKRLWASRKLLSFKNTSPLWVLIQLKWRQFLTCIIYAMYSHQAIFLCAIQAMPAIPLCGRRWRLPTFSRALSLQSSNQREKILHPELQNKCFRDVFHWRFFGLVSKRAERLV